MRTFEKAAAELAIQPVAVSVHRIDDIARAVRTAAERQGSAILIPPDVTLQLLRVELVDLIAKSQIPAIYGHAVYMKHGGLMYYGADRLELWRRAAEYVDRILHGENPGDLPFQQPNKYQLIINTKAAKAIGIEVPPMLLARADEVIE